MRGSFTGAHRDRVGRFHLATGGTLFLDEIDEIPMDLQGKLLRVLQEHEFERVGDDKTIKIDVRIIAGRVISESSRMSLSELSFSPKVSGSDLIWPCLAIMKPGKPSYRCQPKKQNSLPMLFFVRRKK